MYTLVTERLFSRLIRSHFHDWSFQARNSQIRKADSVIIDLSVSFFAKELAGKVGFD